MTDYTITTNFGAKDSLPSGNAGKVIKGSEFTAEFTNIQTAVATKADTAGDTFTGAVNFSADVAVNTNTLFVDVSADKVGIGTSSPTCHLEVSGSGNGSVRDHLRITSTHTEAKLAFVTTTGNGAIYQNGYDLVFANNTANTERMRIDSSGNVGIGTTSPSAKLEVSATAPTYTNLGTVLWGGTTNNDNHTGISLSSSGDALGGSVGSNLYYSNSSTATQSNTNRSSGEIKIDNTTSTGTSTIRLGGYAKGTTTFDEHMRIDSSGNVLVGKTSSNIALAGVELTPNDRSAFTKASGAPILANRTGTDGEIINIRKDGTTVGSIGSIAGQYLSIGTGDTGLAFDDDENHIIPWNINTNGSTNGAVDLGDSARRFKDIYRSGSTYSTSDRNKKQDIRDLTDAEARVATVAKGSLKAFRYIDAVEAGGDDANIHFGIIAQDLKAAFEAEGLNADNYQVLKTSTYTDDDGVEQTTYSVCYENLLAFIISAI